jgi:hypothetical protein
VNCEKYAIASQGKRNTAEGKVCYDSDPSQLSGIGFPDMFVLRVDPRNGRRIFLMFETEEDARAFGKFRADESVVFDGCFHAGQHTRLGARKMKARGKGRFAIKESYSLPERQFVFDITRLARTVGS